MFNNVSGQSTNSCTIHRLPWMNLGFARSPRASKERRRHDQGMLCLKCFMVDLSNKRLQERPLFPTGEGHDLACRCFAASYHEVWSPVSLSVIFAELQTMRSGFLGLLSLSSSPGPV